MMILDLVSDDPSKRFAPYQRMATAIAEFTRQKGSCLPQDLLPLGFPRQETADLWPMAQALAAIELKLMVPEGMSVTERRPSHA